MEAMMSFLLVSAALVGVVWFGLKSLNAQSEKVALQPIRIRDERSEQRHKR